MFKENIKVPKQVVRNVIFSKYIQTIGSGLPAGGLPRFYGTSPP
jgi:hypothetical protein